MLLNHLRDHFAEFNQTKLAAMYSQKAQEAEQRAGAIRQTVLRHEQLSKDGVSQQAEDANGAGNGEYLAETQNSRF